MNSSILKLVAQHFNCFCYPKLGQARPSSALAGEGGWLLTFVPDGCCKCYALGWFCQGKLLENTAFTCFCPQIFHTIPGYRLRPSS